MTSPLPDPPRAVRPIPSPRPPTGALVRLVHDERGVTALTFGLLSFLSLTFVGAAVDIGRWLHARKITMEAIDAATLAGLRSYQETGSKATAEQHALRNYTANVQDRATMTSDNVSFVLTDSGSKVAMTAAGNVVYTPLFLKVLPSVMNISSLPVLKRDNSEHAVAELAMGNNRGTSLEVSLMLDITGSMTESDGAGSTKIATLKKAAKDLVRTLIWDSHSEITSRVALVPFSDAVNLGTTATLAARGPVLAGSGCPQQPGNTVYCPYVTDYGPKKNDPSDDKYAEFRITSNCVTERLGAQAYTDASPFLAPVGRHYMPSSSPNCPTRSPLIPLTADKVKLERAIDGFVADGGTMGHVGTAWAWYTLSPNFNAFFDTAGAAAAPYSQVTALNVHGKPKLQKIAVLMTDGDYNDGGYCNGIRRRYWPGCTANNGDAVDQAKRVCTAMKETGIVVYTVGFRVSTAAKQLLTQCATSPAHFYDATDGNKLSQAFRAIAYQLVPPYLSH